MTTIKILNLKTIAKFQEFFQETITNFSKNFRQNKLKFEKSEKQPHPRFSIF